MFCSIGVKKLSVCFMLGIKKWRETNLTLKYVFALRNVVFQLIKKMKECFYLHA